MTIHLGLGPMHENSGPETGFRLPPPPRRVRLSRWSVLGELAWRGFFSVTFGAAALLLLFAVLLSAATFCWGDEVPGQITDAEFEPARGKYRARYSIHYEFTAGREVVQGQAYIDADQVSALPFELKSGADVEVRVLPWAPALSSTLAVQAPSFWVLLVFLLFFVFFDGCVCFLQYGLWSDILAHWRLVKYGKEAHERIAGVQVKQGSKGSWWYEITFSYPAGVASMIVPRIGSADREVQVGEPITVLYDPARNSRAIAYDFSYFR